jgi:hypothetical protein
MSDEVSQMRWHCAEPCGGKLDQLYLEWKYFNIFDDRLRAMFSYVLPDPGQNEQTSAPFVYSRIYRSGCPHIFRSTEYQYGEITFDDKSIDLTCDSETFIVQESEDVVRIRANLGDVSWDLKYERAGLPIIHNFRKKDVSPRLFGASLKRLLPEVLDWQIMLPRARVTGTITIEGTTHAVDTFGYSDSNWGEWIPVDPMWSWGHCSGLLDGETYALMIGDIRNRERCGEVYLALEGAGVTSFDKQAAEYRLRASSWKFDEDMGTLTPWRHDLVAKNEAGDELEVRIEVQVDDVFHVPLPTMLLPDFLISQQQCCYAARGTLKGRRVAFSSSGFYEHTGRYHDKYFPAFATRLWNKYPARWWRNLPCPPGR